MPSATAQPRFTNLEDAQAHLNVTTSSLEKQIVLASKLVAAEKAVEHYCGRAFAPEPALDDPDTGFQRRMVAVTSLQPSTVGVAGSFTLTFGANVTVPLVLPVSAAQMQTALIALPSIGVGNVRCSGGPLPAYPISVTFAGSLVGVQPDLLIDPSGLGVGAWAVVTDCGFDSLPPVMKRFSTRGQTMVRLPDLRLVEAASDPRMPGVAGVTLGGQRLLSSQYSLGFNAYADGGAEGAIGDSGAEPATEIRLGWGYGAGVGLAQQFAFIAPLSYMSNDLAIVGRWGWSPTPPEIQDAAYAVCARLYRERDAAYSDQLITESGIVFQFFKQLPASVRMALDYFTPINFAVV